MHSVKRGLLRIGGFAAIALAVWVVVGSLTAQTACAHDPRFVCSPRPQSHPVLIPDAGKSWAYYGSLASGQHDAFVFSIDRPLDVPWQLLVDRRDAFNPARPQATLSGPGGVAARVTSEDTAFYEPFSRLSYVTSPDRTLHLQPGAYAVDVTMVRGDRPQRYVMAIGSAERFGLGEIPYVLGAIARIRAQRY